MHKVTITQENGWQTMTTMHVKHGAVVSTRIQTYKMPAPRKKPTEEAVRQARARWRTCRNLCDDHGIDFVK